MDGRIKKRKHAKRAVFYVNVIFWDQSGQAGVENGAIFIQIYIRMHHFVVNFQKKNFASGGKGALTALTKILRTFLLSRDNNCGPRLVNLLRVVLWCRDGKILWTGESWFCSRMTLRKCTTRTTSDHRYCWTGQQSIELFKPRCTASIRQKFFVDRVINVWNALPSTTNFASLNVLGSIEKNWFL